MNFSFSRAFLATLIGLYLSCAQPAIANEDTPIQLKAAGCKTEYFLIQNLARGFDSAQNIEVKPSKTGNKVALKLLAANNIDFAFTCRHHASLVKKFDITGEHVADWVSFKFAYDPIIVIVNRENPLVSLSLKQLKAIFMGDVTNWKELGGDDLPIKVAFLDNTIGSGVVGVFREIVLGKNAAGEFNSLLSTGFSYSGPAKLGAYVAKNKGAITFMGLNSYQRRYGAVINVENEAPNRESILDGDYPLSAAYHIVYDEKHLSPELQAFIDYIHSDEAISITNQSFVFDIKRISQ